MLENNIAYIQIQEFDVVTVQQFKDAMDTAYDEGMESLILDLRGNPGGSLAAVVEIADYMLPKGTVVYTEDKYGETEVYSSSGRHEITVPMVVLVNGGSASAAEILAGAIKDYGVGTLLGTTTYGKGIVQRIIPLDDGSAIKLTVSHYYTPLGNDIHKVGIEPDIVLEFDIDAYLACIAQLEKGYLAGSVADVGVLADNAPVPGLPAKLQRHGRQILSSLGQHVLSNFRRAGVENLVPPLLQAQVRNVVPAVDQGHEFRREDLGNELLKGSSAGGGLGAGLDDHSVSAAYAGGNHSQREQDREVERAYHKRDAVRHLVDLGDDARKAHQPAEMLLRAGPPPQASKHLVDFHHNRADVA